MQVSNTTADLRGIVSVGDGVAWASGTHGTVLRTEDSGFVWQGCTTPPGAEQLDFRGVQAFDAQTAIVMSSGKGDLSRVYKTTDGCKSWKLVFTNPDKDGFFDGVSIFWPQQNQLGQTLKAVHAQGLVFGDPVDGLVPIFTTEDGGEHWYRRASDRGCRVDQFHAKTGESSFAASNQALLSLGFSTPVFVTGGARARIGFAENFSMDGFFCHTSAQYIDLPMQQGTPSAGAFAIAERSPLLGDGAGIEDVLVIVGGDYRKSDESAGNSVVITKLTHFFRSVRASATKPHGYRSTVAYDAPTKTWITTGPNGTDISTDDGRNWRPLMPAPGDDPDADKHWNALSLPFVVGPHGRIGRLRTDALKHAALATSH